MMDIKIKGSGDTRTVWDGPTQIGVLRRHEKKCIVGKMKVGHSATFRQVTDVYWSADHMDGSPVLLGNSTLIAGVERLSERRVYLDTMKAWTSASRWQATATSQRDPRNNPEPGDRIEWGKGEHATLKSIEDGTLFVDRGEGLTEAWGLAAWRDADSNPRWLRSDEVKS